MEKPGREDLFSIKFSAAAEKIFNGAISSTKPVKALKQLVRLLRGKIILRCEAVEYSRSTGKPTRYGWKPYEKWDGRLWLVGNSPELIDSPFLRMDDPLYSPMISFLPRGKTTIVKNGREKFVVQHIPDGEFRRHIKFTKVDVF